MKFFLSTFLLLLGGCTFNTAINAPKTLPTAEEKRQIDEVLLDLQERFAKYGVDNDFKDLDIFVTADLSSGGRDIAGLCRYNKRIILDKDLFNQKRVQKGKIPALWSTILHEIGHCYFLRDHDENFVSADSGRVFTFESELTPQKKVYVCSLPRSIMFSSILPDSLQLPLSARDYFVSEMIHHESSFSEFEDSWFKSLPFHSSKDEAREKGFSYFVEGSDCLTEEPK